MLQAFNHEVPYKNMNKKMIIEKLSTYKKDNLDKYVIKQLAAAAGVQLAAAAGVGPK